MRYTDRRLADVALISVALISLALGAAYKDARRLTEPAVGSIQVTAATRAPVGRSLPSSFLAAGPRPERSLDHHRRPPLFDLRGAPAQRCGVSRVVGEGPRDLA